ncbi:MAG: transposase [candidate division WOR-3 bacterium]
MRKFIFEKGKFYHVYNRGVEGRDIFLDNGDYLRFIHYLYELNDKESLPPYFRQFFTMHKVGKYELFEPGKISCSKKKRNLLVDIICFCLMPNHFHLLLRQLIDNGISQFMQKLGTAWTMFFNVKYKRNGRLFQGVYKVVQVSRENQLLYLSCYHHLNPLDLIEPDWKEKGIENWREAKKFLENYRWSSYLDYIDKENFPSVINPNPIREYFKTGKDYKNFVCSWVVKDLDKIDEILLEN